MSSSQDIAQLAPDCRRSLSSLLFWVLVLFGLLLVCSVALCVVFLLLCFCNGIVTAAGLCTGPIPVHFCGPTPAGGYMYAVIVNLLFLCNMQLNVLNDLAKAKRRWTEKKIQLAPDSGNIF